MTVYILSAQNPLGLQQGAVRQLAPVDEAAGIAAGWARATSLANPGGNDMAVRYDPDTGRLIGADGVEVLPGLSGLVSGAGNTYIRWCIPGRDTSGTLFKDTSGRGNDATIDASNGTPFAVDSRISTVSHASAGGVTLPLAAASCDLATDSWIMAFAMTRANPGANEPLASFGASGGSNSPGIYFSHRLSAAGVGRAVANRGNAGLVSGTDTTVAFSNVGGTRETHVVMAYDAPTRSVYLYRDGVIAASNAGLITGASDWTVTPLANGARLGGVLASGVTVACAFRGWQGYVFAVSGLPLNIGRIAAMLAESPSAPLRDYEFQFTA
jgi:hypothetical protein